MNQVNRMLRSDWNKTPYAGSTAANADTAVTSLLEKYGVKEYQWTRGLGPNGRSAVMLRWNHKGKTYRIMIETLWADAPADDLIRQAYRAMFYYLKSTLEMAGVFFPLDTSLFAFLELPNGSTMYEMASPHMATLQSADFSRLCLPAPVGDKR